MKKIILLIMFIICSFSVLAATNYVKNPTDCPSTDATNYAGQDCSPNDICGDISGIAQCLDTSGISIPSSYNAGYQTQVNSALDAGYVLNCYATTTCDGAWSCDYNTTCYSTLYRTTNCTSTTAANCAACRSGYYDCNADGGICEILNGATCTVGGLVGTYSGCDGAVGNCVVSTSHHITGIEANYSSAYPNLWTHQFGSGVIANFTNASSSSLLVNALACIVFPDLTQQCTATVGGSSFVNNSDISVNYLNVSKLNVSQLCFGGVCIFNWTDICGTGGMFNITGADLTGSDGDTGRTFTSSDGFVTNKTIISVDNFFLQPIKDFTQSTSTVTFVNKIWDESTITIYVDSLSCYLALNSTGAYNTSWNEVYARTIFAVIGSGSENASWNESYADNLYYPLATNPLGYLNISYDDDWISQAMTGNLSLAYSNDTYGHTALLTSAYANDTYEHSTLRTEIRNNASQFYPNATVDALISGNISTVADTNDTGLYYPNATVDALITGNLSLAYNNDTYGHTALLTSAYANDTYEHSTLRTEIRNNVSQFYPNATVDALINGNISTVADTNDTGLYYPNATVNSLIIGNLSTAYSNDTYGHSTIFSTITGNLSLAYNNDTYGHTALLTSAYANDTYEHTTIRTEIRNNASQFYPNATVDALINGNISTVADTNDTGLYYPNATVDLLITNNLSNYYTKTVLNQIIPGNDTDTWNTTAEMQIAINKTGVYYDFQVNCSNIIGTADNVCLDSDSGVGTETDPIWDGNSTLVAYMTTVNSLIIGNLSTAYSNDTYGHSTIFSVMTGNLSTAYSNDTYGHSTIFSTITGNLSLAYNNDTYGHTALLTSTYANDTYEHATIRTEIRNNASQFYPNATVDALISGNESDDLTNPYLDDYTNFSLQVTDIGVQLKYNGTAQAMQILNNGTGTTNNALNIVSYNKEDSTLGINGMEKDRGTIKVVHSYPGEDDSSSSAISVQLNGDTTATQGLFINRGNSTGNALVIKNDTISAFVIESEGNTILSSDDAECFLIQKTDGTDIFKIACSSSVAFMKKIIPISTALYDLGDDTHVWRTLSGMNVNLTENLTVGNNITFEKFQNCNLETNASGGLQCGTDNIGTDTNDTGLYYPNATVNALIIGNLSLAYNNDTYGHTALLTSAYANDTYEHSTLRTEIRNNASQFYPNATVDALISGNISTVADTNDTGLYYPNATVNSLIIGNLSTAYGNDTYGHSTIFSVMTGNLSLAYSNDTYEHSTIRLEIRNNASQFYPNATVDALINGNISTVADTNDTGLYYPNATINALITGNLSTAYGNDTYGHSTIFSVITGNLSTAYSNDTYGHSTIFSTITGNLSLAYSNDTNYVKKSGDNMSGMLYVYSDVNISNNLTVGNASRGGNLRIYQDTTGTLGNFIDINARYDHLYLSNNNGKVVLEEAENIDHALAIQEGGEPYGYVSWYLNGSSSAGTGAFMESHPSAPNITMKLGNDKANSSFRITNENDDILFQVKGDGTISNISVSSIGTSAQYHQNGQCDSRPLISNENKDIYIPRDYNNISDALCTVPVFLRHNWRIWVDGNVYNTNNVQENITITGIFGFENLDYTEGGTGRLHIKSYNGTARINSIYANGITGLQNPWIEKFNVTQINPFDDENSSVAFYGVNQGTIQDIIIYGVENASGRGGSRVVGILIYGGISKVANITFDTNSSRYGFMVKQGGQIWHRDRWSNGQTSDSPYWASIGEIWCFMCNLTSVAEDWFKTSQGTIHMSNGEDEDWNTLYGVEIMPRVVFNNTINLDPISAATCNTARRGEMYFDSDTNLSYTCNGIQWLQSAMTDNLTTKIQMKGYRRNDPENNYFTVYSDDDIFNCTYFCQTTVGVGSCNAARYFNAIQYDTAGAINCDTNDASDKFCQCNS